MFPHFKLDWSLQRLQGRIQNHPDDPDAVLAYAAACLSRARFHNGGEIWYNRALTQARRALQTSPTNSQALVIAGMCLVGLGRLEPAKKTLDQALEHAPERADLQLALSDWHEASGDPHQALRCLENACRLNPQAWEPHALLGLALAERSRASQGHHRVAERSQYHVVRALQIGPSRAMQPALLQSLAVSCLRAKRLSEAQRLFTRLLDYEEYRSKARYYLGLVAYHLGKYKNALLFLRQHLRDSPDNPHLLARIGMCYLHLGEIQHALSTCHHALAVDPRHLQARWTLGCALLGDGRTDESVKLFKDILADAPQHTPAFAELVRIRSTAGDAQWLQQALRVEVGLYTKLPVESARPTPGRPVKPRAATRERIMILLKALGIADANGVSAILESIALTTDEGLRFTLFEAALDLLADQQAREAVQWLTHAGTSFSAKRGRQVLTLAHILPEEALVQGLQLTEDDLRKAAVERHKTTRDVTEHRQHIDHERNQARAWQALLLLAMASRKTRTARNLLLRWTTEADRELAAVAWAALAVQGDAEAAVHLAKAAHTTHAAPLLEALKQQVSPRVARIPPRAVSNDNTLRCSICGCQANDTDHLMVGSEAAICDRCMTTIASNRHQLITDDPQTVCALSGSSTLDASAMYVYQGVAVSAECLHQSLGLSEREEVDRFLAAS